MASEDSNHHSNPTSFCTVDWRSGGGKGEEGNGNAGLTQSSKESATAFRGDVSSMMSTLVRRCCMLRSKLYLLLLPDLPDTCGSSSLRVDTDVKAFLRFYRAGIQSYASLWYPRRHNIRARLGEQVLEEFTRSLGPCEDPGQRATCAEARQVQIKEATKTCLLSSQKSQHFDTAGRSVIGEFILADSWLDVPAAHRKAAYPWFLLLRCLPLLHFSVDNSTSTLLHIASDPSI